MKPLPANLPPLPKRAVYLGRGGQFKLLNAKTFVGYAIRPQDPSDSWELGSWIGGMSGVHFCAPADSEIVRINRKPDYPPLPEGAVYLGLGGTFTSIAPVFEGWVFQPGEDRDWSAGRWEGTREGYHYCADAGSEIVKLNTPQSPADPKQYIIWCPSRGDPTIKQPSLEAAETEVKRLAAKHPGSTYHICEIVASYVGEVTVKKILTSKVLSVSSPVGIKDFICAPSGITMAEMVEMANKERRAEKGSIQ